MTEVESSRGPGPDPTTVGVVWRVEPFLHVEDARIYNPLTDLSLAPPDPGYNELRALALGLTNTASLPTALRSTLAARNWVVVDGPELASRFLLKYVSLEAHSVCNQGCYFCPVSIERREDHFMSMELYDAIARQLGELRETIEGVSMINYNEPTVDKRFLEQVAVLKQYGLPAAVLTNGTGLTPKRVDAIVEMGGLVYLSVNLSTLDRERYAADREGDHLELVLSNLDYMKRFPLAETMEIVVLGVGDQTHVEDFGKISQRFAHSRFEVKFYEVMNRSGNVPLGLRPAKRIDKLCGCEQTGSRPLQWLHITPRGECVICCQDYHEHYVVGDLTKQSLLEVLTGPEIAKLRRWTYGIEEAPDDFICRDCIYARTR